jgi:hypothetical protein
VQRIIPTMESDCSMGQLAHGIGLGAQHKRTNHAYD